MNAATPDAGPPASDHSRGWDDAPTPSARIRVVQTGLSGEVAVPARHAPRLLTTAAYAAAALGVLVGPGLALRLVPPEFPAWAAVGLIAGQLTLLGLVVLVARAR